MRYSGEAKPYETDFLVSLVLLCLSVSWLRTPEKTKGLWLLAVAAPVAVAISLPSMFTIGAIVFVALYELVRRRSPSTALAVAGLVLAVGLSVAAMAFAGQYRTRPEDRAYFLKFWAAAFPPALSDPVALARWLVRAHTGSLFAFPHGGDARLAWLNPVVFGCFTLGALLFVGKGKRIVALLVLPMLLTLAAAALRRYPYGMSARVNLYLVPSVLILTAAGASWIFSRAASRIAQRRIILAVGSLLVLFAVCRLGTDLGHPYRAPWDRTGREFARWFWEEMSSDSEVVCVRSDLGISSASKRWAYDGADQYLCYQRIYSRRHREGGFRTGTKSRSNGRYGACWFPSCPSRCRPSGNGSRSIEAGTRSRRCGATLHPEGPYSSPRSFMSCASLCRLRRRSRRVSRRNCGEVGSGADRAERAAVTGER